MTRDADTNECDDDRVQPLAGLVRQQRELESRPQGTNLQIVEGGVYEAVPRLLLLWTRERFEAANDEREHQRGEGGRGPDERIPGQDGPAGGEQCDRRRREDTASKIIENLPAGDDRKAVALHARPRWDERKQPPQNLPVATHPAVLPPCMREHAGGIVVDDLDIGD